MTKRKSKSSKPTVKKTTSSKKIPQPTQTVEENPRMKTIFWALTGVAGLLMIILAIGAGINGDDIYQIDYSKKLLSYYATFGQDTAALNIPKGNMHYYGGLFDILAGSLTNLFGLEENDWAYHDVRHVLITIFGWFAMLFTALLVKELAGWRAAILAFLLIFLSPRFLGHALMNPKDIPFAMGNMMAIYFLFRWTKQMPNPKLSDMLGLAGGIAIALATRAGGLLLIGYLGLFAGLDYLNKYGIKNIGSNLKVVGRYAFWGGSIALVGYLLAILFWPFALANPIKNPFEALSEFSKLGIKIRVLFEGKNIMSDETPWHYPVTWILRTIPLYIHIGILLGLAFLRSLSKKHGWYAISLLLFSGLFPLLYVIYKDSTLHDGWRHLYFIYPPLVAFTALAWLMVEEKLKENKIGTYALYAMLGLTMLESTLFIVRNPSYPYIYFNAASGGLKGAYGQFETDYWGTSVKQAIKEMEKRGILSPDMPDKITIMSSFSFNINKYLGKKYKGKVTTNYVKYSQRYDKEWDYAIFPARYVRGPHLRDGIWPSSKALLTIEANGVPLTTVLKAETKDAFEGQKAVKAKQFPNAIAAFQKELQTYPDNEIAWLGLANAQINSQQPGQAISSAQKVLEIVPDNLQALSFLGLAKLNTGDPAGASEAFQRTIELDKNYSGGYYYLALISQASGDIQSALNYVEQAIRVNPKFKAGYELAARLLEQSGNVQRAQELRRQAQSIK